MLDQLLLAGAVALVLAVQLRHGLVALVDDDEEVLGEVVEQRVGRLARAPAVDRRRVVLDAVAEADLLHHLEVVLGAHAQALGLEQLALLLEVGQPLLQLGLDAHDAPAACAPRRRRSAWPGGRRGRRASRTRSPVSGSTTMICSISSPNSSMRTAVSS